MAKKAKVKAKVTEIVQKGGITKEKVQKYENVRQSGITNMFDIHNVMNLSRLSREDCLDIMKNYEKYMEEFGIERR